MKRSIGMVLAAVLILGGMITAFDKVFAQDEAAPAAAAAPAASAAPGSGPVLDQQPAGGTAAAKKVGTGFGDVVTGSGWLGVVLWLGLFGTFLAMVYFTIDCAITVRAKRIIPQTLIQSVTDAMASGDVLKALQCCKSEPGPMSNILSAGFSHVEEGYDVIQEAVSVAAEFESERLMQHVAWLSVTASLAPMLGLLGTVQGMIMAFSNLATGGAGQTALLALSISQALWTTAAGLCVAIPAITSYTVFRNVANRITLRMQAITMDLIKDLRNVEVVAE